MTTQRLFGNPHFLTYARLLHQLHLLIRNNADETPQGETLREQMDGPAEYLSSEEVDCLNAISADFYTSNGPPTADHPETRARRAELMEALDTVYSGKSQDFAKALDKIRESAAYLAPIELMYLRGSIWALAGEFKIATDFLWRAKELDPQNPDFVFMWLDALSRANPDEALMTAKSILQQSATTPAVLVFKAAEIVFLSTWQMADSAARAVVQQLVPVFEDAFMRFWTSGGNQSGSPLPAAAILLLGFCHERLDNVPNALKYFDKGIQLFPNNDTLLTGRGTLLYGTNTKTALQDFQQAVLLRSPLVWPYFFLAHNYLLHGQFEECLEMASLALRLATSALQKADCLEWIAICQATLGYPPEIVRAVFDAAQKLVPENKRISRNLQLFESTLAGTSTSPVPWETIPTETVQFMAKQQLPMIIGEHRLPMAA